MALPSLLRVRGCVRQCLALHRHLTTTLTPMRFSPALTQQQVQLVQYRSASTVMAATGTLTQRVRLYLLGRRFSRRHLVLTGLRLYINAMDKCDYRSVFCVLDLPDTFHSWFLVMNLHVWMVMGRVMQEPGGRDGKLLRNGVINAMWDDVTKRVEMLASRAGVRTELQKNLKQLHGVFTANVMALDEGLLASDRHLAAALYSHFNMRRRDAEQVELMVGYVRAQVEYLNQLDPWILFVQGDTHWLPLPTDTQHASSM